MSGTSITVPFEVVDGFTSQGVTLMTVVGVRLVRASQSVKDEMPHAEINVIAKAKPQ